MLSLEHYFCDSYLFLRKAGSLNLISTFFSLLTLFLLEHISHFLSFSNMFELQQSFLVLIIRQVPSHVFLFPLS